MSWAIIRPQIAALIDTVEKVQEIASVPKIRFDGFPAVHIVPSDNESDYETTGENERTYAWIIRVFHETKNTSIEEAYTTLEEVVDEIIDLFDQEDQKDGQTRLVGVNLPERYTFLNIYATPNRWGSLDEEALVMAEITIRVKISVDIT